MTIAQLAAPFRLLTSEGAAVHLTGDGGDSLFMPPPVHLADLARAGAYQKAGFRPAGRLRQSGYRLGRPCDELLMDAIADDFLLTAESA